MIAILLNVVSFLSFRLTPQRSLVVTKLIFVLVGVARCTNSADDLSCSEIPPFTPPFKLSDNVTFDELSTCPFSIYEQITGKQVKGCFPIYNIPYWDNFHSISFVIRPFGAEPSLFFERKSTFATWEDLISVSTNLNQISSLETSCIDKLSYKAQGVEGEISGRGGTKTLTAVVISFKEDEQSTSILLPVGGCVRSMSQTSPASNRVLITGGFFGDNQYINFNGRELESNNSNKSCSILSDNSLRETSQCLRKCYSLAESKYVAELDELTMIHDEKTLKNYKNRELLMKNLLITRTSKLTMAFARCKCNHQDQDLGHCVLRAFLDDIVTENSHRFEIEEVFDRHLSDVVKSFQNDKNVLCELSIRDEARCRDKCLIS